MKHQYVLAAMAVAAMTMSATAMADPSVTQVGSVENASVIEGTNLLCIEGSDGCALATLDGTEITDEVYYRSMTYGYNMISAYKYGGADETNANGVLSLDGQEIVPFVYGDIKLQNKHWVLAYKLTQATADNYDYQAFIGDGYWLIDTVDVYYVDDAGAAALKGSFPRANFDGANAYGDYINIEDRATGKATMYDGEWNEIATDLNGSYDTGDVNTTNFEIYRENGQQGVKDLDGNVIMAPSFQYVYDFEDGYARVSTGEKEGLIDEQGNVVVPAEFDRVNKSYNVPANENSDSWSSGYVCEGYISVENENKIGWVANGQLTSAPNYAKDAMDVAGASAILTNPDSTTVIVAADGVETPVSYDTIRALSFGSGILYEVADADYKKGVIDWHGNEILPCQYDDVALTGDGQHLIVEVDYNNTDIYDISYDLDAPSGAAVEASSEAAGDVVVDSNGPSDSTSIKSLIDACVTLANTDLDSNKDSIVSTLNTAVGMLGEDKAEVKSLISSVVTLFTAGTADANTVVTLLNQAAALLG